MNKQRESYYIRLSLLFFAVLFFSCNPAAPVEQFSFRVSVTRSNGDPVPGIRVSAWNHISLPGVQTQAKASDPDKILQTSTITFAAPEEARVTLSILDLNNTLISHLQDNQLVEPGIQEVSWDARLLSNGVYKCSLTAKDTSSSGVLYQDFKYAYRGEIDPALNILGWTSSAGIFETQNKVLFPNLFSLPPLIHTTSTDPAPIDSFTIRDTVTIVLTDTSTHQSMSFERVVQQGINNFELIWEPTIAATQQEHKEQMFLIPSSVMVQHRTSSPIPERWKLYQNYPNPF